MRTHLGQIFWGLLLVILSFKINQLDLLPDFIGYILIAVGAGGLVAASGQFIIARYLSWTLVPLSLISLVAGGDLGLPLYFINAMLNTGMIWFLLGGIGDLAMSFDRPDLADQAAKRRIIYVSFMGLSMLLVLLARADSSQAALAVVLFVVIMLAIVVLILQLIWQVREAIPAQSATP